LKRSATRKAAEVTGRIKRVRGEKKSIGEITPIETGSALAEFTGEYQDGTTEGGKNSEARLKGNTAVRGAFYPHHVSIGEKPKRRRSEQKRDLSTKSGLWGRMDETDRKGVMSRTRV